MRLRKLAIASVSILLVCQAGGGAAGPRAAAGNARGLRDALNRILQGPDLRAARVGMRVVDLSSGRMLFEHQGTVPLKPASNMKVITSAAALSAMGPEYRFETAFLAARLPVDGVVAGDLVIRGSGSPSLPGEEWWRMAREVRARGVKVVAGDLVGDDSFFDDRDRPEGWPPAAEDAFYNAPVAALNADYGAVTIVVSPSRPGSPPEVVLTPFASFFDVRNRAVTQGTRSSLRVGRLFDGRRNEITVDGSIAAGSNPVVAYRSVERPTEYALAAFREAAAKEGIVIKGKDRRGITPAGSRVLFRHESRPLADLIRIMNKMSNNYMAECLLKALGAHADGPPGTTRKGARALASFLESNGVPTDGLVLADGSGLSHANRLTAAALTGVLRSMFADHEAGAEFVSSLAIGGVDGTLDKRLNGGAAQRRIRGKTGYLNGALTLSGYAYSRSGRTLAFAILVNTGKGGDPGRVRRAIDQLASALVESDLPAADESAR